MNNEQQELLNEAYENYCKSFENQTLIEQYSFDTDPMIQLMFLNKCKTNPEFSERWGLKIEERELSEGERGLLIQPLGLDPLTKEGRDRLWKENNLPTKVITITYNNKTIISYE
jgi:hypothetical protein